MSARLLVDPEGVVHVADDDGALCGLDWLYSLADEEFVETGDVGDRCRCYACEELAEGEAE